MDKVGVWHGWVEYFCGTDGYSTQYGLARCVVRRCKVGMEGWSV
jgi:hypothetical protein